MKNVKIGDKFNSLEIKEIYTKLRNNYNEPTAKCLCDCGNEKEIRLSHVVNGDTKTCGCLIKEISRKKLIEMNTIHNLSRHPIYSIHKRLKNICNNEKFREYKKYGALGIKLFEDWKDIKLFYEWSVQNSYQEGHSLKRKDESKDFCPDNCYWINDKPKVGDKFNALTIENIYIKQNKTQKVSMASCKCDCGNITDTKLTNLVQNHTKSCGCLRDEKARERTIERNTTHNLSRDPLYARYVGMIGRCAYPSHMSYKNYGGKGIFVCDEWKQNFQKFYDWSMENGYKPELTLDRIDRNGPYSPENCRFITPKQQNCNKSNNVFVTAFGETKTISEWIEDKRCNTTAFNIKYRISQGYSPEDAISKPTRKRKN